MKNKYAFTSSLVYFIIVCIFVVFRALSSFGLLAVFGEVGSYVFNAFFQIGILFLFPFLALKVSSKEKSRDVFRQFSYQKISLRVILVSLGLGVLIFVLNIFISSFFHNILLSIGYKSAGGSDAPQTVLTLILGIIFTAIIPAICEEHTHRGMLLSSFKGYGSREKIRRDIILVGVLFGLLHFNIEQCFYAIFIGIFLGNVCINSNSIYPCMIIHFVNNFLAVVVSYLSTNSYSQIGLVSIANSLLANNLAIGLVVVFVFLLVIISLIVYLYVLMTKFSVEDSFNTAKKAIEEIETKTKFYKDYYQMKSGEEFDELDDVEALQIIDLYKYVEENGIENMVKILEDIDKKSNSKYELRTKVLIWASAILAGISTIFTLVWGIIC